MPLQVYFVIGVLLAFGLLALAMYFSIKKHNKKMAGMKKKKGFR